MKVLLRYEIKKILMGKNTKVDQGFTDLRLVLIGGKFYKSHQISGR